MVGTWSWEGFEGELKPCMALADMLGVCMKACWFGGMFGMAGRMLLGGELCICGVWPWCPDCCIWTAARCC
jgi:hypothetical protein